MRSRASRHYRLVVVPNPTLPVTKMPKADAVVFSHALGCDEHLKLEVHELRHRTSRTN